MTLEDIGLIGWRGMVGTVLLERMRAEGDFAGLQTTFYSTSQVGLEGPDVGTGTSPLVDAYDIAALRQQAAGLTRRGGNYPTQTE
jgi:aspartate-semialdehyde dehydrogenase